MFENFHMLCFTFGQTVLEDRAPGPATGDPADHHKQGV